MDRRRTLTSSTRAAQVALPPERAWDVVTSGERGSQWYVDAPPYAFRGALDRLVGGPGRRWPPPGRPRLRVGDKAGFWEVLEVAPEGRRLVLQAVVRAPGTVRVVTEVEPGPGGARVTQTTSFDPSGLLGRVYLVTDLAAREVVAELTMLHLLAVLRRAAR